MLKERGRGETRTLNESSRPSCIFKLQQQREEMLGVWRRVSRPPFSNGTVHIGRFEVLSLADCPYSLL